MLRAIAFLALAGAIVVGTFYKLRDVPAIGALFLSDTDPARLPFAWPPQLGKEYPDVKLIDQTGKLTSLSEFRGKVILVELVGIPCGACQAYAGAHEAGIFRGGELQTNLKSIEAYAREYGNFDLRDDRVVFVQLLLFNKSIQAPSAEEARAWAEHFGMVRSRNRVVLVGTAELATRQSYDMIPGFHLIDRDFLLRRDSSGHRPMHNLYTELLPAMGEML